MVCTTLRPTVMPYPELESWEGCSKLVADHLKYEPLEDFPTLIVSIEQLPYTYHLLLTGTRNREILN